MPMFFNTSLTNSDLLDIYNGPELINTVAPSITGLVIIGETITCDFGTWILPSPFTGTNGTVSYEYQWYRSDDDIGTNEVPIVGETNSTYTLVVDDTSKHLRCKVRAINSFGGYDSNADTYSNFISIGSGISYAKRFEPWISEAPVSGTITSGWYVGSPNLVVAEDGTYWACHDEFQPGTVQNTRIYKSLDSGATWSYVRVINNSAWPTLFEYNDTLYILSCSAQYGDLVLHYSSDDWATFNTLTISSGNYHKAQNAWIEKDGYLFFAVEDVQSPTPAWGTDFLAQIWYVDINDLTNLSNWRSSNTVAYNTSWGELDWGANSTPEGWLEGNVLETQGGDIVVMYRHSNNVDDVAAYLTTTWNSVTPSLSLAFNDSTGFVDFPGGHVKFWPVYDTATDRWFALTNYDPHSMTESDMITTDPNNRQSLRQSLWLISAPTLNGSWSIHAQILRDEIENTTDDIFSLTGWQYITPVWDGNLLRFTSRTGYNGANSEHNANRLTYHEVPNISETINASRSALEYANSTWNYSAEFIIESGKVATDQNNFTVRVDLSQIYDDDFWNSVMLDGGDIRVTDDTNTEVPSWIDPNNFCQQSRTGIVFAKINYSAASGATLRVKAGNSSASAYSDTDTFGKNNVFDSNVTTAFWHGKRLSSNASSNTGNMNDGSTGFHRGDDNYLMWGGSSTSAGAPASISHYSDLSLDLSNNNTIEVVVEPTDLSGGDTFNATNPATIIQKGGAPDYILRLLGDKLDFTFRDSSNTGFLGFRSESGVITATRQHISITTDGISVKAFIDGVEINFPQEEAGGGNYPDNGLQTTDDLHVAGRQGDGLRKLRGGVDGIRFHNIVRSNDWLSLSAQQDKNILEFSLLNNVGPDVDTTSPTVSSATINSLGTQYTIVYSEAVTGQTGHTLSATGGAVTLTPLSGNGTDTHIWTLSRTISSGETVTRSYTPGNAVDGSDNALEAYSGQSVTNGSGYPPPSTTSAFVTTAGNILTLGFSENVTGQSGWTLNASGGVVNISGNTGDGTTTHTFTLSRVIDTTETLTLDYDSATGNAIDDDGFEIQSFSGAAVINNSTADTSPAVIVSSSVSSNGNQLTIVLDKAVTGQNGWTINPTGGAATLTGTSGNTTDTHVFNISRTIDQSETLTLNYDTVSGNALNDYGVEVEGFTGGVVTNGSTVDGIAPVLVAAEIDNGGHSLVLVYSENVTGQTGFSLTASGGAVTLSSPAGDGTAFHKFVLSRKVLQTETVTLDYTPGTSQDDAGNILSSITNKTVVFANPGNKNGLSRIVGYDLSGDIAFDVAF
jgi:hypothetical protein